VLGWGLAAPALWLDESATVIATQRSWPGLWHLTEGSEAPLVPYYALVKITAGTAGAVLPAGAVPPEVLYRLPSVLAAVLAAWVLGAWLARVASGALALASIGALLLVPSFSRYGQEARPYAFTMAAAVLATVAWSRLVGYGPRRAAGPPPVAAGPRDVRLNRFPPTGPPIVAALWYAAAVTALTVTHVLAASLVAAHLALAVLAPGELGRRRALRRTVAGAAAGLLVALPLAAVTLVNGRGPRLALHRFTPAELGEVFFQLFTERRPQVAGAVLLLAVALLGLTRLRSGRYGAVARLAAAWALVPPVALLPLAWLRPNLMTHRYLIFVVPGWAILTGLGLITIAGVVRRLALAAGAPQAGPAVGRVVVVATLAAAAVLQGAPLAALRGPAGHGEDIRPALEAARADGRDRLPLVMSSRLGAVGLAPYARDDESRLLGVEAQRTKRTLWPTIDGAALEAGLRDHPEVVLLLLDNRAPVCRWRPSGDVARYVTRCMPPVLREHGYHVVEVTRGGRRWTTAVLSRQP
jgi:mannosyltransferase